MKKLLLSLSLLMAVSGCTAASRTTTSSSTEDAEGVVVTWDTTDDFYEWDEPRASGRTPLSSAMYMASKNLDVTKFKNSAIGMFMLETMNRSYTGNDDPESAAYWERLGLIKTVYDDDDDEDREWALYVPESYDENDSREYPLLFLWHGYNNSILIAEQYGFLEEAANEEYIVVIPWASNDDLYLEETERIYNLVTSEYRIDEDRVYSTGFSLGGQTSLALSLEKSDMFAAVVACGDSPTGEFYDENHDVVDIPVGHGAITEEDFAKAEEAVPVMFITGDSDVYYLMPFDTEEKVDAVNAWLDHCGIDSEQSYENSLNLLENGEDEVENRIGLDFDETQIRSMDTFYYIGSYYNNVGENTLRIALVENGIHTTTRGMARLAFEFFEEHSR